MLIVNHIETPELLRAFGFPGGWELIVILILVLVVFGAGKLPTVGSALGKGIRNFQGSLKGEDPEKKDDPKQIESKSSTPVEEEKKEEKDPVE